MSTPPSPPTANGRSKRYTLLAVLAIVFLSAGAAYGAYWTMVGRYWENTDDAYVGGNQVAITPRIAGTVIAVHVDDTDRVKAGETLVKLDDSDTQLALRQAEAQLAETVRRIHQAFETVKQDDANVARKRVALRQAGYDLNRRYHLIGEKAISRETLAHAWGTARSAQADLRLALARLAAARALVAGTTVADHPAVRQAEAQVREAYLALSRCHIVSPVNGYIAKRSVQVGQRVAPGAPLMAVVPLNQLWVKVNLKEDKLAHVRIGQPVTLTSDIYGGGVVFHGKVEGLSPGTGGAFALLPPQNASGNWIKIIQRLPVRVSLNTHELERYPLRIGLSMRAKIDTHDRSGPVLAAATPTQPRYATTVYVANPAAVEARIQRIVNANNPPLTPAGESSAP